MPPPAEEVGVAAGVIVAAGVEGVGVAAGVIVAAGVERVGVAAGVIVAAGVEAVGVAAGVVVAAGAKGVGVAACGVVAAGVEGVGVAAGLVVGSAVACEDTLGVMFAATLGAGVAAAPPGRGLGLAASFVGGGVRGVRVGGMPGVPVGATAWERGVPPAGGVAEAAGSAVAWAAASTRAALTISGFNAGTRSCSLSAE